MPAGTLKPVIFFVFFSAGFSVEAVFAEGERKYIH